MKLYQNVLKLKIPVLLELITNTDKLYTQKLKTLTFCIYDVEKR